MNKGEYLDYFDSTYKRVLSNLLIYGEPANRHLGFRHVFEQLLAKKTENFTIVETGTLREPGGWGDGQSSLIFYEFLNIFGGKLVTIDINGEAIHTCRQYLNARFPDSKTAKAEFLVGNSLDLLLRIDEPVDFLYLDSFDFDPSNPSPSMVHHLQELVSSWRIISKSPGLLIGIDDNLRKCGKGTLIKSWAQATHQQIIFDGYQIIIRLTNPVC